MTIPNACTSEQTPGTAIVVEKLKKNLVQSGVQHDCKIGLEEELSTKEFSVTQATTARGDSKGPHVLPDEAYMPFLSKRAKNLRRNELRDLLPMEHLKGMISLLAGKPNPSTFPITSVSFSTRHPSGDEVKLSLNDSALCEALQYNMMQGLPALVEWVSGLQERVHGRERAEGWSLAIGVGSADMINKTVNALFDPGDSILIESPGYPGIVPLLQSLNVECVEIPMDKQGVRSDSLAEVLDGWPVGKLKPKALYTVPIGSNPSGCTTSLSRRKEVLFLAMKHNFLILEDDPYFYLYYGNTPRPSSYFSLEAQSGTVGRVIRFDSFSKILSSGFRLGYVTGPSKIVELINVQTALANLQPSTFDQGIVLSILQSWGHDNFLAHAERVSEFYRNKRDAFVAALERHLKPFAEWDVPFAGMFIWLKLSVPFNEDGKQDSAQVIRENAMKAGVLALPGIVASPSGRANPYCRVSFSLLSEDEVEEACRRLAKVVKEANIQGQTSSNSNKKSAL